MAFRHAVSATVLVAAGGLAGSIARAEDLTLFPAGTQTLSTEVHYVKERTGEPESLASANLGLDWYLADRAALGVEVPVYRAHDEEGNTFGTGLDLVGRYHFLEVGKFTFFGDAGAGVMETAEDWPAGGTRLNFTYLAGLGITYQLSERVSLIGGGRFQHVSNAFIEGRDRNPIFNGFGGHIGLLFAL